MANHIEEVRMCTKECEGCFGQMNGYCSILNKVYQEGEKKCHFYKTVEEYKAGLKRYKR